MTANDDGLSRFRDQEWQPGACPAAGYMGFPNGKCPGPSVFADDRSPETGRYPELRQGCALFRCSLEGEGTRVHKSSRILSWSCGVCPASKLRKPEPGDPILGEDEQ